MKKRFYLILAALMCFSISPVHAEEGWSSWSETPTGNPGEISKVAYKIPVKWSDWSEYVETEISSTTSKQVESRVFYKVKGRKDSCTEVNVCIETDETFERGDYAGWTNTNAICSSLSITSDQTRDSCMKNGSADPNCGYCEYKAGTGKSNLPYCTIGHYRWRTRDECTTTYAETGWQLSATTPPSGYSFVSHISQRFYRSSDVVEWSTEFYFNKPADYYKEVTVYSYPLRHYIYYDVNGGSGYVAPTAKWSGTVAKLSSEIPTAPNDDTLFIGWAKSPDATVAEYKIPAFFAEELTEDITLYAVYDDLPKINITGYYPSDVLNKYTNEDVKVYFTVSDDYSGLKELWLLRRSQMFQQLKTYSGEKTSDEELTVRTNMPAEDNYYLMVIDQNGRSTYQKVVIDKIDKAPPYTPIETSCGTTVNGEGLTIDVYDNQSGIKYWGYKLSYVNAWGDYVEDDWVHPNENSITVNKPYSTNISVELYAEDNAGNTYSLPNCSYTYNTLVSGDISLVDYSYVFDKFNNQYGSEIVITDTVAREFIGILDEDDNQACKSALRYIQSDVRSNGVSKAEALRRFFEKFMYGYITRG